MGKKHGRGKLITNEFTYTGEFFEDTIKGFGLMKASNFVYTGEFINSLYDGYGILEKDG